MSKVISEKMLMCNKLNAIGGFYVGEKVRVISGGSGALELMVK